MNAKTPRAGDDLEAHWDAEYVDGRWDFLDGLKEQARSGILAAWLMQSGSLDHVLDVGCGEGLLHRFLQPYGMKRYSGVDVSGEALKRARARLGKEVTLHQATLEDFEAPSDERYSAIVFNEVLYFPEDPAAEVARYASMLSPGGMVAVSMYAPKRPESGAHRKIDATDKAMQAEPLERLDALKLESQMKTATWWLFLSGLKV
ncbi:MAG: class I SAM-dependent methyltransferase [Pseudomonadota bacterium]